jgi:hypothetical protein
MKTRLLLPLALCSVALLSGCVYDDGYAVRHVSVSTGTPYYGRYDAYSPYYSYSGRRYYRDGGRYVYYRDNRPAYVTTLPSRAVYVTPSRSPSPSYRAVSPYYRPVPHRHRHHDCDDE